MAAYLVTAPDGTKQKVTVPEGATEADAIRFVASGAGKEPEPTFLERTGERLSQVGPDIADTWAGRDIDRPSFKNPTAIADRVLGTFGGDVLPAVGDVVGDAVMSAGKAVLPHAVQDVIGDVTDYVSDSAPVKAIGEGLSAWRERSPGSYDRAGDIANLASVNLPRPKLNVNTSVGTRARQGLDRVLKRERKEGVDAMLEQDNLATAPGKVTEEGFSRRQTYEPTEREARINTRVEDVPEVNPRRSNMHNMNAVEAEVGTLAKGLDEALEGANPVPLTTVADDIAEAITDAANSPTLVGDAGKVAERIYGEFDRIVKGYATDGSISAKDLLQARRDLDNWLRDSAGNVFDMNANARSVAVKKLRQAINKRVADASPDVDVTGKLREQSDLLTARDLLRDRAGNEGRTGLERTVKQVEQQTGLSHPKTPLAVSANIRSIPALIGTTASVAGGTLARASRAAAVKTLEGIEAAVDSGAKLTAKMQADRLAALAVINQGEEE